MRMRKLVGRRLKEDPKEAQTSSHKFLIRGGYARMVSAGIYSFLPLGKRIIAKIEKIIRDEMDGVDGQEVMLPVVLPMELWDESGRSKNIGDELLRFSDRNNKEMLLAMTHEEAITHLVRTEVSSYKQLPVMLYQIQTKYRDEARPRGGLIRTREFTMKDAYSFHTSQNCLNEYYDKVHAAYERIFQRLGMDNVVSIKSDSGMMGGDVSHEFMAIADCGEDTIFISPDGKYKANRDIAVSGTEFHKEDALEIEKVSTPGMKTIEEVADYLGVKHQDTGKAVFFVDENDNMIFAMIRGDFEVNETKLKNYLKVHELNFAEDDVIRKMGAVPGYASPLDIDRTKVRIVVDNSVAGSSNLVVGANEEDFHYKNFNLIRDLGDVDVADIAIVREGDPCPVSGQPLIKARGIEVGNIFQLGTKYSEAMNCKYLDQNGKSNAMIMGCYGIGVARTMAAVIENCCDDWGPIWPLSISPYHVHFCVLNINKPIVNEAAEGLYQELIDNGVEVLFDDRGEKAGCMFNDADLIGIPYRIVISPKTLAENKVELKTRGSRDGELVDIKTITNMLKERIDSEIK